MSANKKVWITGVTGFTGYHLVQFLRESPERWEIVGLDCQSGSDCFDLDGFHEIDLTDWSRLKGLIEEEGVPDYLVHLAGLFPPVEEADLWKVNVGGTQSLLQAIGSVKSEKKPRIVSIGSAGEYLPSASEWIKEEEPCGGHSLYGRTKWAQTAVALASAREWGLHISIARTFNLLGPGLSPKLVGGALAKQFLDPETDQVEIGDTRAIRDFVDIRDAVAAYWKICTRGESGEIYNVCRGKEISIQALLDCFIQESPLPKEIVVAGERNRTGESDRVCGDSSKLRALGWTDQITMEDSVRAMLRVDREPKISTEKSLLN